jgi:uncharacterized protein YukE
VTVSDTLAAWLRRVGVELGPTMLPGPAWLARADLDALRSVASRLDRVADELDSTRARLHRLLGDTASALGWQGEAADRAGGRARRSGTQLAEMADLLRALGRTFARHAMRVEDWREELRRVLDEAEHHAVAAGASLPDAPPFAVVRETSDSAADGHVAALNRCAGRLREVVADAEEGDRACASRVVDLGAQVLDLAGLAESDDWVGDVVPEGARRLLAELGIVESAEERRLVDWAAGLPDGAEGTASLRTGLGRLPPAEAAGLAVRHPEIAARLASTGLGDDPVPGSAEALLADAVDTGGSLGPDARVARVADLCAALPPDVRRHLALLYPTEVGNLDGVPLADRVAANRVALAGALHERQALHAGLREDVADPAAVAQWAEARAARAGGLAADLGDPAGTPADHEARVAAYARLLYEEPPDPAGDPDAPARPRHQLLVFDDTGPGRLATLHGPLAPGRTAHVGVLVPDGHAGVEGFPAWAESARALAARHPGLAVVTWQGAADAGSADGAEDGGAALREFARGLGVPEGVRTTVVGHGDGAGVVAAAARAGLPADRVLTSGPDAPEPGSPAWESLRAALVDEAPAR